MKQNLATGFINMTRKEQADYILYQCGLAEELEKYGIPHIVGSYRMDTMAWNDLDIDIENDTMSLSRLYKLSDFIIHRFQPLWYEAKEERTKENKTDWFHGFETLVEGELWNIDLWFFDRETINKTEQYCDTVKQKVDNQPELKEKIITIKQELILRGKYSFDQYTSMDVYDAVLNQQIFEVEDFLKNYTALERKYHG